jgi:anti-anti-sigma factor
MNALVTTHRFRRVLVVRCQGELDLCVRTELASALSVLPGEPETGADTRPVPDADTRPVPDASASCVPEAVVVDLADVTFLDCTALGVLIGLADRCARRGRRFLLSGPRPIVRRMFVVLRLDRLFVVTSTVAEAIAVAESWSELETPASGPAGPGSRPVPPAPTASPVPGPVRAVSPLPMTGQSRPGQPGSSPRPAWPPLSGAHAPSPENHDPRGRRWLI